MADRIVYVALGGTIGYSGGDRNRLGGAELAAGVPGLERLGVDVEPVDFRRVPSSDLTVDDLAELAVLLRTQAAREGVRGLVVSQGTDTLEESAFLLDLLHAGDTPLVLTGAMRHAGLAGPDGPANLLDAVRTAASPAARGRGALVVFGGQIHAARHVRKAHATSVTAFASPSAGPLGQLVEDEPCFLLDAPRPRPAVRLPFARPAEDARVALIETGLGDDGTLLRTAAASGAFAGLVVAAAGVGHTAAARVPELAELAARMPVVLASRTGAGSTLRATYRSPGSEHDLLQHGLIGAGFLDPRTARVLLTALLRSGTTDRDAIAAAFAQLGGPAAG